MIVFHRHSYSYLYEDFDIGTNTDIHMIIDVNIHIHILTSNTNIINNINTNANTNAIPSLAILLTFILLQVLVDTYNNVCRKPSDLISNSDKDISSARFHTGLRILSVEPRRHTLFRTVTQYL